MAATYALDQSNKWLSGLAASLLIGVGHLVSSLAMVGVFFYAKSYFSLTQVNEPIRVADTISIGGPVSLVAGVVLVLLGFREYRYGHSHDRDGHSHDDHDGEHEHAHEAGDHSHHSHDHAEERAHQQHTHEPAASGIVARLRGVLPFGGGHSHSHASMDGAADRGLFGIAWFAFLLGFAHEEEFEIIALCAGSTYCLELMSVYAVTVIVGIVGLTMVLIAGYQQFEATVERYTPYLPAVSAAVLIGMGGGFILGIF